MAWWDFFTLGRLGWPGDGRPGKNAGLVSERNSMPVAASALVHPTAIVSAESVIAEDVRIGPYVVIDGPVSIGPGCVLAPYVHLVGPLVLGRGNNVGTSTVIGSDPQHLAYQGQPTRTEIGDFNVFREHVTVHRGSHVEGLTRIGHKNYFMAHSHVAHDCKVGNECILANGSLMGGHCELQDRVFMSGSSAIHQFVRMGRLSLLTGLEGVGKDVVPFVIVKNRFAVLGVNAVGMKRAGISTAEIMVVRKAFQILYRSDLLLRQAIDRLAEQMGDHPLVAEMLQFIRESKRGVMRSSRDRFGDAAE